MRAEADDHVGYRLRTSAYVHLNCQPPFSSSKQGQGTKLTGKMADTAAFFAKKKKKGKKKAFNANLVDIAAVTSNTHV